MKISFEAPDSKMKSILNRHESHIKFGDLSEWKLEIRHTGRTLGFCDYKNHKISIHSYLVEHGTEEQILDTLYHECARMFAGIEYSQTGRQMAHGRLWKSWAHRLGAVPKATVKLIRSFKTRNRPKKRLV